MFVNKVVNAMPGQLQAFVRAPDPSPIDCLKHQRKKPAQLVQAAVLQGSGVGYAFFVAGCLSDSRSLQRTAFAAKSWLEP